MMVIDNLNENNIIAANTPNKCLQCGKELTEREFDLGEFCDYCVGE